MGEHAVVVGGGIAGLAAAGVLASRFERVTVLERDRYAGEPSVRPHAPQGAHVHVLLAGGLQTLTRLVPALPGWFDEMGMPEGDLTEHVRLAFAGRWLSKVRSGIPVRPCTRPVLEHLLLRDVSGRGNVEVLDDCKVVGIEGGERDGGRPRLYYEQAGELTSMRADLLVDASGRASAAGKWLAAADPVEEEVVDAGVTYSSCSFTTAAPIEDDWMLLASMPQVPREPNSAAVMRVGPDRLLCAHIAYGRPRPPGDPEEFVDRMRDLPIGELYEILRDARPTSEVYHFSGTANRLRRYDEMRLPIDRFVIIGDALCTLNPRYGQGMTIAALGAETLGEVLDRYVGRRGGLEGFAADFQGQMGRALKLPWRMALLEDRLWVSSLFGPAPGRRDRLIAGMTSRALDSVFANVDAYIQFMRVAHMLDAPQALISGRFAAALLRRGSGTAGEAPGIRLRSRASAVSREP